MAKTKKIRPGYYVTTDGRYVIASVEAWTDGLSRGGWHVFNKADLDAGRDGYCDTYATKGDALASLDD